MFRQASAWRVLPLVGLLGAALALSACGGGDKAAAAPASPPPPEVGIVTVQPGVAELSTELPGRLEAYRTAQVRARAAGILDKRLFIEGADVRAGQPLFSIDAAPYKAALASAQATLQKAEANLQQAEALAERYASLVTTQAVSQQEALNAKAAAAQARADVAAGKAAVQTAQINLGYASVTAPIAGRIGRALVTEGALVGQGEATPLAVVQQIDPLYVNFTQSAAEVMRLREALAQGKLQKAGGKDAASVQVLLDDGHPYPLKGRLLFSDLSVDPASGQITLRAELPNPKGQLLPGLYVRVRLAQAQANDAVWVPQQSVSRGPQGATVLAVGAQNLLELRKVQEGATTNGRTLILSGLGAGDRVVVDGFQKAKVGSPVKPVDSAPAPAASAASR
jgi:membrane fusion protein (multidrug efflux system)